MCPLTQVPDDNDDDGEENEDELDDDDDDYDETGLHTGASFKQVAPWPTADFWL